jgi:hypothetical protein
LIKRQASQIAAATTGIILLGTPHGGTDDITANELLKRIILAGMKAHHESVNALRNDNEMVLDTVQEFAKLARETDIPVHCFFEMKSSEVAKMFNDRTRV